MSTRLKTRTLIPATLLALAGVSAHADGIGPMWSAARESKPIVDLRLRSEDVDQDGMAENATAVTLRGRLGFETGKAWNTSLLAEGEGVWPLVSDYNSTTNGKTTFPGFAAAHPRLRFCRSSQTTPEARDHSA